MTPEPGSADDAICGAAAGVDRQRAVVVTAPDTGGGAHAGSSEKAAGAETAAHARVRTGFDCAAGGPRRPRMIDPFKSRR